VKILKTNLVRPALVILASALLGLFLAGNASAGSVFGVADNHPVGMKDDGNRFYTLMNDVGLTENRITVLWNQSQPTTISRKAELERALAQAKEHGIKTVFSVYPQHATALAASPSAPDQFVTFLQLVANSFPDVTTFVVGNEFNQPKFYQPQFASNCKSLSGGNYMRLLAKGYDALKAVNPDITVISSVSPRGNDDCHASNNRSTSPVRFIRDMGAVFRRLGRNRPAFDEFGIHLYPNQPTDSIDRGYQWPKIGASNLDRLKQSLWDAFIGTAQPVPDWQPSLLHYGQGVAALRPMKIWEGELGWQVGVQTGGSSPYYGRENVAVTTESNQAQIYAELVRRMACDSSVDAMLFYGLVDEPNLDRFQAGLLRADWTKRPAYAAVERAIARSKPGCQGQSVQWHHIESVLGAGVDFGKLRVQSLKQTWWGFAATAKEDATYSAGIFQVQGRQITENGREAIIRALSGKGGVKPVLAEHNVIKAYWSAIVRFPAKPLSRGSYVYGIRMSATMNPDRTRIFVSRPFQVGK
jgi:hypothetical protein